MYRKYTLETFVVWKPWPIFASKLKRCFKTSMFPMFVSNKLYSEAKFRDRFKICFPKLSFLRENHMNNHKNKKAKFIKGFQSYFKVVVLAPSFCGESSFRVIRDLCECIFSEEEKMNHF